MTINITAPVCPISRSQAVAGQPGLRFPVVPHVVDMQSALTAANIIRGFLPMLAGLVTNNMFPSQPFGQPVMSRSAGAAQDNGQSLPKKVKSRWVEKKRNTIKKKFYSPDDKEIWIEVERITYLKFHDNGHGIDFIFQYGDD